MAGKFSLRTPDFHVAFTDLLHAVNLRNASHSFTFLPKEGVMRIFLALKNPTTSAGFEPANLGFKGQHTTSRPPKTLTLTVTKFQKVVALNGSEKNSFGSVRTSILIFIAGIIF
jgi:hypothetical protein